ncbi:MAG: TIGR02466 family protein [Pseudomonadota bacterium]
MSDAITSLFATHIYSADLPNADDLNADLAAACLMLAEEDAAGEAWCVDNDYDGYTSYASLNDLRTRTTAFETLANELDKHANQFAEALNFDMSGQTLVLDSYWVNVLNPGAMHSGHIHPHSVLSGTYYVQVPDCAGALRFEDPRLVAMMAAPTPRSDAPEAFQRFVYRQPSAGRVMMWESWLRHEVTPNNCDELRISLSFNYALADA